MTASSFLSLSETTRSLSCAPKLYPAYVLCCNPDALTYPFPASDCAREREREREREARVILTFASIAARIFDARLSPAGVMPACTYRKLSSLAAKGGQARYYENP